ncbi:hypothetical protein [Asanoa iriomotensis]|uniref:DUF4190 domain-containing protein n=1 Tax=Asanoa iriomotensis TaxID=234613 RepID=A0ABQ4BV65_9ACTN|nr:hypothetical protein [Asanoa iriomotensis]GIF54428.1 hypothetical protein Air01nite_05230 [Asanoa iriomotensis]
MTNPYPPQGYGPPAQPQNNTLGLLAMIIGILSIPGACCRGVGGIVLGAAAIVLGYLGKQKVAQGLANNGSQAQAGFICGIVGAGLGLLILILAVLLSVVDLPGN